MVKIPKGINRLPLEVLGEVFKFLGTADLRKCMFVNRLFDKAAHNCLGSYIHLILENEDDLDRLQMDLLDYPRMATKVNRITVAIHVKHWIPWIPVVELCPNLTVLKLNVKNPYFFLKDLKKNDAYLPNIQKIQMSYFDKRFSPACYRTFNMCYWKYIISSLYNV